MRRSVLCSPPALDRSWTAAQYANSSSSGHVPFVEKIANPYSAAQKALSSLTGADKECVATPSSRILSGAHLPPCRAMRRDSEKVSALDFDRIITCHGVRSPLVTRAGCSSSRFTECY
jgi:hypothetical protein